MGEVIRDWITKKLGIIVDFYRVPFSSTAQNGVLLAKILKSCGVISTDQFKFIKNTKNPEIAFENYNRYIKIWLKELNILISETEIREIANGEGNVALNLFYKVYLKIFYNNIVEYETIKKCKEVKPPKNSRFKVTRTVEQKIEEIKPVNLMVEKNWDVINWHRDKMLALSKKLDQKRLQYREYLRNKTIIKSSDHPIHGTKKGVDFTPKIINYDLMDYPDEPDLSYDELIKEQRMVKSMPKTNCNIDHQAVQNSKKIFKKRKCCFILRQEEKEINQKDVLQYLREILVNNEQKELGQYYNLKFLKCSTFEQECLSLLCEIRNRKFNLFNYNRYISHTHEEDMENDRQNVMLLEYKQSEDVQNNYYFERDRINELYDRISHSEVKFEKDDNVQMCSDLVNDLIDYAESVSMLNKNFTWPVLVDYMQETHKLLFLKCKTVQTIYWPFEEILFYDPKNTDELNMMYAQEMERQNAINEVEFENYFYHRGTYEGIKQRISCEDEENNFAKNILGFIINRLLLYKYPFKMPYSKPHINKPLITACVVGVYDFTILSSLKAFLKSKEIEVIQVQEVVNYCIESWKKMVAKYNMNVVEDEQNNDQSDCKIEIKTSFSNQCILQRNNTAEEEDSIPSVSESVSSKSSKCVQVENLVQLSEIEMLGKSAYETLITGKCLSNYQIASMVVNYLKLLNHNKGWVLINFPETYDQAILLESMLSGIKLPNIEEILNDKYCGINYLNIKNKNNRIDMFALRKSNLAPDMTPVEKMPKFPTYFSSFINIFQAPVHTLIGKPGLSPVREETNTNDNLIKFYSDQECYYSLQYQILDVTTIKYLAKMIIGDYSLPIKNSLELLGEVVLSFHEDGEIHQYPRSAKIEKKRIRAPLKAYVKVTKPKSYNLLGVSEEIFPLVNPNDKGDNTKSKTKQIITEDKQQQFPEIDDSNIMDMEEDDEKVEPPEPGHPNYIYENISIDSILGCKLATISEIIDQGFYKNVKNHLFMSRCLRYEFLVYIEDLKKTFAQLIKKPDEGPKLLKNFQEMYNSIEPSFRKDDEIKCELHYQIHLFKLKMLDIYLAKMRNVEQKRIAVIDHNYVACQVISMIKTYTKLLQIELDQCQNLLEFIQEYYTVTITSKPNTEPRIKKITIEDRDDTQYSDSFNEINYILKKLLERNEIYEYSINNMMNTLLEDSESAANNVEIANMKYISKLEEKCLAEQNLNAYTSAKKGDGKSQKLDILIEIQKKMFYEWYSHLKGGMSFTRNRLRITCQYVKDLIYKYLSFNIVHHKEIKQNSSDRFERERQNIETIVHLFSMAVESEKPFALEIDILDDKLVVRPKVSIFKTVSNRINPIYETDTFTLNKIDKMVDIFIATSATGSIPEREFIFTLHDMIINNAEDGSLALFPRHWQVLKAHNLNELSNEMFCQNQMVNWKDFVLWLINCFPNDTQLLKVREQFKQVEYCDGFVNKDNFYKIDLVWLKNKYGENDIALLKNILFKMYRWENTDNFTYLEMLLDFCKDENSILGYVKALELYIGKLVCVDSDMGKMLSSKYSEEKSTPEIVKVTRIGNSDEFSVDDIINDILQNGAHRYKQRFSIMPITDNAFHMTYNDVWPKVDMDKQHKTIPMYIYLSLDIMIMVLATVLYSTMNFELDRGIKLRSDITEIFQQYKYYNFGKNVPCFQVLNDDFMKDIINSVYRFTSVDVSNLVNRFLQDQDSTQKIL